MKTAEFKCFFQKDEDKNIMCITPPDYRYLSDRPPDISSDKLPGSGYTGQPLRSMKNGLRTPPVYGVTQRKPLKAVSPAFDALRTVLPVTCRGSSPQSYRASRSVPLPDMQLSPSAALW